MEGVMGIKPEMLILAREFNGMSQEALSRATGLSQPRIARAETGIGAPVMDDEVALIASALRMPVEFFRLPEHRIDYGTSSVFTRTRKLTARERKLISAQVNVRRIQIKKMLDHVDVHGPLRLPRLPLEEYGTPAAAAQSLRVLWKLPQGPVKNMTTLLESAGVLVVECDFHGAPMDATSVAVADMPPMVFINKQVPADRLRFTLAHELGHLVMHELPAPSMEDEADDFASEFLAPASELAPMLAGGRGAKLHGYLDLKKYWKMSMAALILKAERLGKISTQQQRSLYIQMSKLKIRKSEPAPLDREVPQLLPSIIRHFRVQLGFSEAEFAKAICFSPERLRELYDDAPSQRARLSVVR
jgi:Zn-dependent peptidase ImmA (M78 family)/transcriptional regulator with XRE-family HTH domain